MSLLTSILLLAVFGATPQLEMSRDRVTVHPNAAEAQIKPRASSQRADYGESIDFSVRADFRCRSGAIAESVVVSIADTHLRHVPAPGEDSIVSNLSVPGEQLAPAETGNFCTSDTGNYQKRLVIPAIATVQVSLRCRAGAASAISFKSAPLPLHLVCQRDATGHDPSDSSAAFPM